MGIMFAGTEVLRIAVELEKTGREFYDKVVEKVKDEKARDLFSYLSAEERRHQRIFQEMLDKEEVQLEANAFDETEMNLYFRALMDHKIVPSLNDGTLEAERLADPEFGLEVALKLERDAILFFNELSAMTREGERKVLQDIIQEERNHIMKIMFLKKELIP